MGKTRLMILFLVVVVALISAIVGMVLYYNRQPFENITFVNVNTLSFSGNYPDNPSLSNWNWTLTLDLKNTGNVNTSINNIIIDGKSYTDYSSTTINPSIEKGYYLSPLQNVTITIQGTNTPTPPNFHMGKEILVITALGTNYSYIIGS
jgi:hypothetical protein